MTATLFDFNGVLVDDEHVHLAAFREVLSGVGLSLTDAQYTEKYLGFDDVGAFSAILRDHGRSADQATVRALVAAKVPVYMRRIETELRVFDGAAELVRRRASRGAVFIVSGALRHEIEHCLRVMGVAELFAGRIVSAEDTRACKPDPEGYRLAKAKLGGARAVAIEDSVAGVIAARAAGVGCAGVTTSYPRVELERAGASPIVTALAELDDALLDGAAT